MAKKMDKKKLALIIFLGIFAVVLIYLAIAHSKKMWPFSKKDDNKGNDDNNKKNDPTKNTTVKLLSMFKKSKFEEHFNDINGKVQDSTNSQKFDCDKIFEKAAQHFQKMLDNNNKTEIDKKTLYYGNIVTKVFSVIPSGLTRLVYGKSYKNLCNKLKFRTDTFLSKVVQYRKKMPSLKNLLKEYTDQNLTYTLIDSAIACLSFLLAGSAMFVASIIGFVNVTFGPFILSSLTPVGAALAMLSIEAVVFFVVAVCMQICAFSSVEFAPLLAFVLAKVYNLMDNPNTPEWAKSLILSSQTGASIMVCIMAFQAATLCGWQENAFQDLKNAWDGIGETFKCGDSSQLNE